MYLGASVFLVHWTRHHSSLFEREFLGGRLALRALQVLVLDLVLLLLLGEGNQLTGHQCVLGKIIFASVKIILSILGIVLAHERLTVLEGLDPPSEPVEHQVDAG